MRGKLGLILGIAILLPIQAAHACLFDIPVPGFKEGPTPFPPCDAKSVPGQQAVRSKMVRLGGKMVELALEIQNTKAEVRAWQQTVEGAKQVEETLRQIEGDLTVNPMTALVSNYERSPALAWVKEAQGLKEKIVNTSLDDLAGYVQRDLRAHADSIMGVWTNTDSLSNLFWGGALVDAEARRSHDAFGLGSALISQQAALEKFRNDTKSITDSLTAVGNRMGVRYENQSSAAGEAEAKISGLAANLAKLRGTAYGAQAAAIQQKLSALNNINRTRAMLEADRQRRTGQAIRF